MSPFKPSESEAILLGKISEELQSEYESDDSAWIGSPFAWIKARPSRQKGAIGERLVQNWCESKGFKVARTGDSDADRSIRGRRVEIKFSTLWKDNGIYKFQQIRDQDYEYCFCLGISPFEAHAWFIPKKELLKLSDERPELAYQHGGKKGTDTRWLSFEAAKPPAWLKPFGGTLTKVETLIRNLK